MSNKCPYCGSERIRVVIDMCGYRASCNRCGAIGMDYHDKKEPEWLIADFCHPAHLLNETDVLPPDDGTVPYIELTEARRLKEVAEAGIAQMKEAQMRGDLIKREDAERVFCDSIAKAKANLEAIPNRCAELLVGQTDAAVVRAMLTREIEGALAVVCGEVPNV